MGWTFFLPVFVRTKRFDALAGVLLSITGCEAMFANLGQFNAVRSLVYRSLRRYIVADRTPLISTSRPFDLVSTTLMSA